MYFGIIWYQNDTSGESIFAFITGMLIPFLVSLRKKKEDSYKISITENQFISKDNKINITFPKVAYKDNSLIENKINKQITNIYMRHHIDIKKKKYPVDEIGEFKSTFHQSYQIKNILGIKFTNYMYYAGAAHGNSEIVSLNINLQNGEEFEFKDVFRGKYIQHITDLVKEQLKQHRCYDSLFDLDSIRLKNTQEFYISENSLIIVFFKYEIAPGCYGPIEIELDLKKITKFINPNGPLFFLYSDYDTSSVEKGHTIICLLDNIDTIRKKIKQP